MNNPGDYRRVGLLVLTVLGWACDDAADGAALEVEKFDFRECKNRATGELLTGRETSDYDGLECVAWDFGSRDVAIDLINRPAGCGFDGSDHDDALWRPAVKQSLASQIEFDVQWNFSDPSACGGCLHDFSVKLSGVELEKRVRIDIATRSCTRCSWQRDSVRAADPSGIRCRYVNNDREDGGTLRLPPYNGRCDGELVLRELPDGGMLCLSSCESDDDCPLGELESCADGVCVLRDPW